MTQLQDQAKRFDVQPVQMFRVRFNGRTEMMTMDQLSDLRVELERTARHGVGTHKADFEAIMLAVCSHLNVDRSEIIGRRRPDHIVWARHLAMYLCRRLTDMTLEEVGEFFGGRDHGTVLHAGRNVRNRMDTEPKTAEAVANLVREIEEGRLRN